jgi:hypothetical protein
MVPGIRLFPTPANVSEEEKAKANKFPYAALVGKCMYLATCSRPDLSYTIHELARFMSNPGPSHVAAAKHLLRYIKGSLSPLHCFGIWLGRLFAGEPVVTGLSDSDWGMGDGRKSVSGFLIMLGPYPVSWSSKQQAVVALSSCEAEYLAVTHCVREVLWFRNFLAELGFPQLSPTTVLCDNQGTVSCTHDPHAHSKMKHISIREHFIRDCIQKRLVNVIHVSNHDNQADLLTKPLHRIVHRKWIDRLKLDASQGGVLNIDSVES